jgi:hypothetical protein
MHDIICIYNCIRLFFLRLFECNLKLKFSFGKNFLEKILQIGFLDKTESHEFYEIWKQLQASGGCVKLTIDGYMLTLKEEASIQGFF